MAKRSKRKRRGKGTQEQAEREGLIREALEPRIQDLGPEGVLSATQPNPPRVKGHVSEAAERAILDA